MNLIDTHTHLYLEQFDSDRNEIVKKAINNGVEKMLLPNIDATTISSMMNLCKNFPETCYPMMGLHPGSVKEDYLEALQEIREQFFTSSFIAVGEVGIDLYWDQTYKKEQIEAFHKQVEWSIELNLPLVIHCRNSFSEIIEVLKSFTMENLNGIFHSFTGNMEQAKQVIDLGFYLGINGIVTFKNAGLCHVVKEVGPDFIVLETDAPYLSPVPNRGKRNDSSNLVYIARKVADCLEMDLETVIERTTRNALSIFKL